MPRLARKIFCASLLVLAPFAASAAGMSLHSTAFDDGQPIPKRYSCDGQKVSPPLMISGVPEKAKSLALIVSDPDAPSGTWFHWVVYNMAPRVVVIATGASKQHLPGPAATAANSYHDKDYGALCPPKGDGVHHYHFQLYALDTRLPGNLDDAAALKKEMQGHVIAKAEMVGTYKRK